MIILILPYISFLCASCAQTVGEKSQVVEDVFFPESTRDKGITAQSHERKDYRCLLSSELLIIKDFW
jgi:hypothetical protein